jgi:predicted ribonuclease YlaK
MIYGDGKKADDKIVEKLVELSSKEEKVEIILISADRDLNMRCQLIKPILHTSGKYFFKYCKYNINRKYKGDKKLKHMAKGIAVYD